MEKLEIIDIIDHQNKYSVQRFIVVNREPNYLYERKGNWLLAEDSGLFSFYYYERPSKGFYAFAGREFNIPMINGSIKKAYGQWWDRVPSDYQGLIDHVGCGTPETLARCYVFSGCSIDSVIITIWLSKNEPSNNYYKYDKRNPDYRKQKIVSRWE